MSKYLFYTNIRYILVSTVIVLSTGICLSQADRPIDGFGYNQSNPQWGASFDVQPRLSPADYLDGISTPKLGEESGKENPRIISNVLFAQEDAIQSDLALSDYTWVFGQFVDHDIILTEGSSEQLENIIVPSDDEFFEAGSIIRMARSEAAIGTGVDSPREHVNRITAFLDLSNVYGSDNARAEWLRSYEDGKLKVSTGRMLPWNTTDGEFNGNVDQSAPHMADDTRSLTKMYVAGDVRANENPLLIAFHTLYVREHNRLCEDEKSKHPGWNDERLYQAARARNIAQYQHVIYNEWLPSLGVSLPNYTGYNESINPQILNEFSTAAFRMGHTLINSSIIRMDNRGSEIKSGSISLRDAFFNPLVVEYAGGVDAYFKGMATQVQQEFDCKVIDDVRNFLFGAPGQGGLDLAAININRGRERGLSDYNTLRAHLGMTRISSFNELTEDADDAVAMASVFGSVDNVDVWVGMLAEPHIENGLFGDLVTTILERQFQALREGDRFYYQNMAFDATDLADIQSTTMRDVLMRNTGIALMQAEVFRAMPHEEIEGGPELIPFPLDASIYPNPVESDLQIKVYGSTEADLTVTVIDYMGRVINTTSHHIYEGNNTLSIDIDACPRGYYNVLLETGTRQNILKMIKR